MTDYSDKETGRKARGSEFAQRQALFSPDEYPALSRKVFTFPSLSAHLEHGKSFTFYVSVVSG